MRYKIIHKTEYVYAEPASLCYNEARLIPRSVSLPQLTQTCLQQDILVEPPYQDYRQWTDYFGNQVVYYTIREPHTRMILTATSLVNVEPAYSQVQSLLSCQAGQTPWETVLTQLSAAKDPDTIAARQFTIESPKITLFQALGDFSSAAFTPSCPVLLAVNNLMQHIWQQLEFLPGETTVATPITDILENKRGVCQDYAHLMIACLRARGLAARYVSGYIETLPPPGKPKLQGSDASHAWCSVYVPQLGWVDFDPTNNLVPTDRHVILGWGRDFADVTPLKGVFYSTGSHKYKVSVDVIPVNDQGSPS